MLKRSSSRLSTRWNGQRRVVLVEPLSDRLLRLRIARGYSVYELATAAGVFAGTIKCLESGKPADKRVLPALATALDVPFCELVCGDHNCAERACISFDGAIAVASSGVVSTIANCKRKSVRVRLPAFLRALIRTMALHAYDVAKHELGTDLAAGPETLRHVAEPIAACFVDAACQGLRQDFERITLFGILFRSHADQSRRMDSVDATLGVVLTALLVLAPIAFDKGPTQIDKWIALAGFGVLVVIVGRGLFFIRAEEPNAAALGAKVLGDLKDPVAGTLEEVRIAIRTAADPRYVATKDEMVRRGAAGDLVQSIAEDRERLWVKRFHLGLALAIFIALTGVIGWRDVIQSPQEEPRNGSVRIHREALEPVEQQALGRSDANSGVRGPDVR